MKLSVHETTVTESPTIDSLQPQKKEKRVPLSAVNPLW